MKWLSQRCPRRSEAVRSEVAVCGNVSLVWCSEVKVVPVV